MLLTCQPGYEALLARELAAVGLLAGETGEGWVGAKDRPLAATESADWCFAHAEMASAAEVTGGSVNALAGAIAERFLESARSERFEGPWPLVFSHAAGMDGLGRRAGAVETAFGELLRKKMGRVAKLASADAGPRTGVARGLFVHMVDFGRAFVARDAWFGGQCRMADDPAAPSRSYLKVEEAYWVIGNEPGAGETVVDLGAAPGGWSYSAARRGARVVAIDNGPLKGGALANPQIDHRREDAFRFRPATGERFDWLFCDLVEDPHHVLRNIVDPWLAGGWCRRFVINLKFGRADALALLAEVRVRVGPRCSRLAVRHLFHDREEFTLMGEVA